MPTVTGSLAWSALALQALAAPNPTPDPGCGAPGSVWADLDGDGFDELVVSLPDGERVFQNRGDGRLDDVSAKAGLPGAAGSALSAADVDGDGREELLLLTPDGSLRLFGCRGELEGGLHELTPESGLGHLRGIREARWHDVDRDGWTDLFVVTAEGALGVVPNLAGAGLGRLELLPVAAERVTATAHDPLGPVPGAGGVQVASPTAGDEKPAGGAPSGRRAWLGPQRSPEDSGDSGGGGTGGPSGPAGTHHGGGPHQPACPTTLLDQASAGCVPASSVGTIGALYPLSTDLNVDAGTGNVGMGTAAPQRSLHVFGGSMRVDGGMDVVNSSGDLIYDLNATTSTGSELRIYDAAGILHTELDSDHSGGGDGFMTLGNGTALSEQVFVDGGSNDDGGEITLRNDAGVATVELDGDLGGGGSLRAYDDAGGVTFWAGAQGGGNFSVRKDGQFQVWADAEETDGGASLKIYPNQGAHTVLMDGHATNGGADIEFLTQNAGGQTAETLRLQGDDDFAGRIELLDANGVPPQVTALLRGEDSFGSGSEITISSSGAGSTTTIDLDGLNGNTGEVRVNETDGSAAFWMLGNTLTLRNASGTTTQSYDRQTGSKSAVVDTESHGLRQLYAIESPEVWLEDLGRGRLRGGAARVELDPVFLETVTIDDEHPMRVFVTPAGRSPGVYVQKGRRSFVVRELPGGPGDASFDWRVVAKRRGLERSRLDPWTEQPAGKAGVVASETPETPEDLGTAETQE